MVVVGGAYKVYVCYIQSRSKNGYSEIGDADGSDGSQAQVLLHAPLGTKSSYCSGSWYSDTLQQMFVDQVGLGDPRSACRRKMATNDRGNSWHPSGS